MTIGEWIRDYAHAWETADASLLLSLFTEDATYRFSPFREPQRGHEAIRGYWQRATASREICVTMGTPFIAGPRVAVEWWATMITGDQPRTLPGCLLLRFAADGRCSELREYWIAEPGLHAPFRGWGS
jgi:hypothetical protein